MGACQKSIDEPQPPDEMDTSGVSPRQAKLGDLEAIWQRPTLPVCGVLLFLHGKGHSALDFFERSKQVKRGCGLPEELALVRAALAHGWLPLVLTSPDRRNKMWNPSVDGKAIADAVKKFFQCECLTKEPIAAFGISNGGAMALILCQWMPRLRCVVSQIMAVPPELLRTLDPAPPPTLFVHMGRVDSTTAIIVRQNIAALRQRGVPAVELVCGPKPITDTFFADRIAGINNALSLAMQGALREHQYIDGGGFLLSDPRVSGWRAVLRRHASTVGDRLIRDESPISEELNVAWGMHETTSEWVDEAMEWCASGGKSLEQK